MSYIALARKWRPRTFSQLVGQNHVNQALVNSLNAQRLHHAYLFTGTRGVGKTSTARLLAKAMNCEQGISAEPCLKCSTCLAIEQGHFVDLIEIDGASRTRVEDTRDILDNIQYAPTSGRYKIYIIDEVHMLSQHSFNALLKTLEEPPAHVKFILATTDPQKLPVTVLSRCLQFHMKPITLDDITAHLSAILTQESITFEKPALDIVAKAAAGSMRDALSLLDQAIAHGGNQLQTEQVKYILGHTHQDFALQLILALAERDSEALLNISHAIAIDGGNYHYVLNELIAYLHQMAIRQLSLSSPLLVTSKELDAIGQKLSPEDIQLFYQIAIKGVEEIHLAPTSAIGFDMTILRMYTFQPAGESAVPKINTKQPNAPVISTDILQEAPDISASLPIQDIPDQMVSSDSPSLLDELSADSHLNTDIPPSQPPIQEWHLMLPQLKLTGLALNAAENAEFSGKNGQQCVLKVAKAHRSIFTETILQRIQEALSNFYQESIKLSILEDDSVSASPAQQKKIIKDQQQQTAQMALERDAVFQQLKQDFSAELVKNSITSTQDDL